ncbi:TIGR02679 domain-containing protein [Intestinibacter sp.]
MKKALEIVNKNKLYIKILKEVSKKYKSYERFTGSFTLKADSKEELDILYTFDDKVFENKKAKISVKKVVNLFEDKLENTSFLDFLKYTLKDEMLTSKELKKIKKDAEYNFYNEIILQYLGNEYNDNNLDNINLDSIKWFKYMMDKKVCGYNLIKKYYNESEDLNLLKNNIISVLKALDNLPYNTDEYKCIPVFATEITRNPHFFDRNQMGGNLLKYGIAYKLNEAAPNNIENLYSMYLSVGLLKDEISNHTTIYNIKAYKDSYEIPAIREYNNWKEPLQISISNLLKIDKLQCIDNIVFVFENPAVFEQVKLNIKNEKSLICTSGQLNLSSYMILDKISNLEKIYYAGDLDPEGIQIANNIKNRYKDKVEFIFYTKEVYEKIKSDEEISERRLNMIKNIKSQELGDLIETILESKKSAYQEMLIQEYVKFIDSKKM